ncbi:MAG: TniQ family protein [Solirubrobacteraceae bacterium]
MRTLPLRLAPVQGESLPGYVARYSHTFQFPPGDVLRALGLDGGSGTVLAARRYGAWLPPDQLERAAVATGIDPATVELMLLSRFAGRAFAQPAGSLNRAFAAAGQGHEVLIHCSRFCPRCLHENGAWLLRWQLGWSFVCVTHRLLLVRRCPSCDTVPKRILRDTWPSDRTGALSDPARCAHRSDGGLCRAQLASADPPTVGDAPRAAQRRINAVLDGESDPTLAGVQLGPPVYLRDLLTLCNLLHRHAQPSAHAIPSRRLGRRLHDHPADLAAVLPGALALADLPDPDALTDALRELADERYRDDGQTLLPSKTGPMSEQLTAVLQQAVSQAVWASPSRQLGFHPTAHRRPDDLDQRLQPRHVAQLFWAEDYHREIADLFDFDDFTHWLGRRFCSVLLTRMLTPLDWLGAVRHLDLPETRRFINEGYNTTFAKLRSDGRFDELVRRVKRIANQHAQHELIDYKQRRARLADWDGIDQGCWHLLPPRARPISPFFRKDNPVRRQRASLWLWSQLTSGDERAGPIAIRTNTLHEQTHFANSTLAPLRERLLILGELLLKTPSDARSTLHNRLAATLHQREHLTEDFHLHTIDPLITDRVLAHVSARTGVDVPALTTPSVGSHAPPAVTHARLLAARLLRHTSIGSFTAIGAAIRGDGNHLAETDCAYREAVKHNPRLAAELNQLTRAIDDWHTPPPDHPTAPHHERMHDIATGIRTRSAEILAPTHGAAAAQRASITLCRQHTDLTCPAIAAIHQITDAQPTYSPIFVDRHRRDDPSFDRLYRQLLTNARELRQQAGFADANLTRGLTAARTRQGFNYVSHTQLR